MLRDVVRLVPGHLGARLLMARAFYSTGQADMAHQALQVRKTLWQQHQKCVRMLPHGCPSRNPLGTKISNEVSI